MCDRLRIMQLSDCLGKSNESGQSPSEFICKNRLTYLRLFTLKKIELKWDITFQNIKNYGTEK